MIAVTVTACLVLLQREPSDDDVDASPSDDTAAAVPMTSPDDASPAATDAARLRRSDDKASEAVDRFMADNGLTPDDLPARTGFDQPALIAQLRTGLYADDDASPAALIAQMQSTRGGPDSTALAALTASADR